MRYFVSLCLAGVLGALGGCYQDEAVIVHEPGVYKGTADPLLGQPASDRQATLLDRFKQIQTDR